MAFFDMTNEEQMQNVTPERLKQLRQYERERKIEKVMEENKPEWLKDKERAEEVGRRVIGLFSREVMMHFWLPLVIITVLINLLD